MLRLPQVQEGLTQSQGLAFGYAADREGRPLVAVHHKDSGLGPGLKEWIHYIPVNNDFSNLDKYFSSNFIFVKNHNKNKDLTDLYLLSHCKYFIVSPSTFSWWGAWLSKKKGKICVRPKNLNVSNNKDFWPKEWKSIL